MYMLQTQRAYKGWPCTENLTENLNIRDQNNGLFDGIMSCSSPPTLANTARMSNFLASLLISLRSIWKVEAC